MPPCMWCAIDMRNSCCRHSLGDPNNMRYYLEKDDELLTYIAQRYIFFSLSRLVIFLFNFVLFMFKLKTIFILIIWFWCNLICYKFLYVLNINFVVWYYQVFVDYEKYSVLVKYFIINKNVGIKFDHLFGPLEQRSQ